MSAEGETLRLSRSKRMTRTAWALGAAILLAVTAFAPLPPPGSGIVPTCGFRGLTGLPCALCGGTRAAQAILRGNWPRAQALNPLAFPAVGLVIVVGLVAAAEAAAGRILLPWAATWSRRSTLLVVAGVFALLIWWPPHLTRALRENNAELIDLQNPIARALQERMGPAKH
jgi:hypothetical protein